MINIFKDPLFIGLFISFGAFIFVLTLVNIRVCIILLFFAVALSPKFNVGGLPLRVEDFFMIILCFSWIARLAIKRENFPSTGLNFPIVVYLLTCFISTGYGYYSGTTELFTSDSSMSAAFHFFKKIQMFLMAYIIVASVNTKEDLIRFIKYILLASTILALLGLKQGLTEYRIVGPMGEGSNTMGMYFVFITIIAIGMILSKSVSYNKLYLSLSILIYLYVVLRTLSRVSYVTFFVTILFLGIFKERRLLLFAILLVVLVLTISPSGTLERITTLKGVFDSGEYFSSWEARKWAWRTIPPIVMNGSPLFGFGLASAPLCYAESEYVTVFYFTGVLGILAFIWIYVRIFKMALFLSRSDDELIKTVAVYFIGALVAFIIGGISGPVFTAIRTTNILWIFVGLIAGARNLLMENKLNNGNPT
jgi:hypothetical protein